MILLDAALAAREGSGGVASTFCTPAMVNRVVNLPTTVENSGTKAVLVTKHWQEGKKWRLSALVAHRRWLLWSVR